ncbi:MAG: hypothetical protein ACR2OZ_10065 [Verrucomicrobiales bacterium]
MKTSALTWPGLMLLASPALSTILLNEVHIDPPNGVSPDDGNYEFIELRSTTDAVESTDGLTIVVIDSNGATRGEVEEAWSLQGLSTGTNGLLLIGDDYVDPAGGPWSGTKTPATAVGDPSGTGIHSNMGLDNLGPNDSVTVLLVRGWTGLSNAATGTLGDVDVDNNSVLDWTQSPPPVGAQQTVPWTAIEDSIGYRDSNSRVPYTSVILPRLGTTTTVGPGNVSRLLGNTTANSVAAWYGGTIAGSANEGVAYDRFFGPFQGQATPGQPNLNAAPVPLNVLINEVSLNPSGPTDGNFEYVEVVNTTEVNGSKAGSLQGYTLVVLGSNNGSAGADLGKIIEAWNLGSFSTGSNGLLLIGNNYVPGATPWGNYLDPATRLAEPEAPLNQIPVRFSSMGNGDLGDNNGFTLLLVQGYNGTIGQDLDLTNDGILDAVVPWTALKDSIGFDQVVTPGPGGKTYATGKIAVEYDPDHFSRKLGNLTPNSAAAWYGGDYGGNSSISIGLKADTAFGGFKGEATPGRLNLDADAVAGPIRLNEIQLDPVASPDSSFEYIELISSNLGIAGMTGLTLVIAESEEGANNGRILESIELSGLSTGTNGLVLLGDAYDNIPPYDLPQKQTSADTNREDPQGLDVAGDIGPNTGLMALLVKGPPPATSSNVSTISAADIVDSIGFGSSPNPAVALVSPGFIPDNLSRHHGDFASNTAAAWYGGELDPAGGDASTMYSSQFFGPFKGNASPGRYSHAATPDPAATLLLNEININPPGGDNDKEFVELVLSTGRAASTNGYSILLIDVDGNNTGSVLEEWSLDGMATGTNGLLLVGNQYTAASQPWINGAAPDPRTRFGFPPSMDFDDIGGANNTATLVLLVKNFQGNPGDDLDAGTGDPVTGDDDGTFDTFVGGQLVDSAGVRFWDIPNPPALPGFVGRAYSGTADLSQSGYTPDTVARLRGNLAANSAGDWYGGDIVDAGATATGYDPVQRFPSGFLGRVTPGVANIPTATFDSADPDTDSVVNILEEALAMNSDLSDANALPDDTEVDVDGVPHPALTFTQLTGGPAAGLVYTIEVSRDLQTWASGEGQTVQVSAVASPDGLTQTVVVRADTSLLSSSEPVFLRLRVSRQ